MNVPHRSAASPELTKIIVVRRQDDARPAALPVPVAEEAAPVGLHGAIEIVEFRVPVERRRIGGGRLGIGVGALFDFLAGDVPRAPLWVQGWRLEWVYRLLQEPSRLARRYLVGNPLFLRRILGQWWSGARVKTVGPAVVEGTPAARQRRRTADREIARRKAA